MSNSAFPLPIPSGGTVTSVGVTSSTLTVTNSPVTSSGNINIEVPVTAPSIAPKNLIFNGSFLLWQRGITFAGTSGTIYTADRWQCSGSGNASCTYSQQPGPTSGTFYLRAQRNSGNTAVTDLLVATSLTRDMCLGVAGRQLTITFKVLCGANFSAALSQMTLQIYSGTGSADVSIITGSFTGAVLQANVITTLTTTEQTITSNTLTLGSNVTNIGVLFRYTPTGTAGANDWFEIRDVQLAVGTSVTGYEYVSLAQEIPRCQYFYCKSYMIDTLPGTATTVGAPYFAWFSTTSQKATFFVFPSTMRIAPAVVIYTPSNGAIGFLDSAGVPKTAFVNNTGQNGTGVGTNDATTAGSIAFHYTADAELT